MNISPETISPIDYDRKQDQPEQFLETPSKLPESVLTSEKNKSKEVALGKLSDLLGPKPPLVRAPGYKNENYISNNLIAGLLFAPKILTQGNLSKEFADRQATLVAAGGSRSPFGFSPDSPHVNGPRFVSVSKKETGPAKGWLERWATNSAWKEHISLYNWQYLIDPEIKTVDSPAGSERFQIEGDKIMTKSGHDTRAWLGERESFEDFVDRRIKPSQIIGITIKQDCLAIKIDEYLTATVAGHDELERLFRSLEAQKVTPSVIQWPLKQIVENMSRMLGSLIDLVNYSQLEIPPEITQGTIELKTRLENLAHETSLSLINAAELLQCAEVIRKCQTQYQDIVSAYLPLLRQAARAGDAVTVEDYLGILGQRFGIPIYAISGSQQRPVVELVWPLRLTSRALAKHISAQARHA